MDDHGGEGANIPAGFRRLPIPQGRAGDFNGLVGPWYVRDEGGRLVFGFRVLPRHLNPLGLCHGGLLATFCDVALPISASYQFQMEALVLPTVSLQLDYLAPTPEGAWVEGRAEVLRRGRRLVFAQILVHADATPVVRASGVFNVSSTGMPGVSAQLKAYLTS